MEFGIIFANTGPFSNGPAAAEMARAAEDVGFESLWTVEHVVVPSGYESQYPYDPSGKMPGPEESPIPDPLVMPHSILDDLGRVVAISPRKGEDQ